MDNDNKKTIEDMVSEIRSLREGLEAEKRAIEQERAAHDKDNPTNRSFETASSWRDVASAMKEKRAVTLSGTGNIAVIHDLIKEAQKKTPLLGMARTFTGPNASTNIPVWSPTIATPSNYAEGAVKDDNLGEPYPEGHIEAGSVNTTNYSFNPYRQGYFIGSTTNTDTLTSDIIRGLQQKRNGAYSAGTVNYQVPVGAARVIIACPATNTGMTKVINQSALNADVTDTFTETQVSVEGANGYSSTEYNVWTFTPPAVYAQVANLAITLG